MARNTILLCLDPCVEDSLISKIPHQIIFKNTQNPLEAVSNCIKYIQSLQGDSISFILLSQVLDISDKSDELVEGLLTLLLVIETFVKDFRCFWMTRNEVEVSQKWIEAFPHLEFIKLDSSTFIKTINLPLIGQIKVESIELSALNLLSDSFKVIKKDEIKGFLSDFAKYKLSPPKPILPAKHQFNTETEGIIFEMKMILDQTGNSVNISYFFLDLSGNLITFIDPVYIWLVKRKYFSKSVNEKESNANPVNKLLEKSFTEWPSAAEDESIDEDLIKKNNKLKLKKLILLSLRGIGIKKSDKQFMDVWKHLYCGCIFSLRKELNSTTIDQAVLLKTIKENIKFLNL